MSRRLLLVCNDLVYLLNFRSALIREMVAQGLAVTIAGPDPTSEQAEALRALGVDFEPWRLRKAGRNPLAEIASLSALAAIVRRTAPDIVFAYAIKPVIYALWAADWAKVPRRVAMITGLGYAFIDGPGLKRRITRLAASLAYRSAFDRASRVIFQNPDDEAHLRALGVLSRPEIAARVAGSGVDLARFARAPLPSGPPVFLMVARLLRDKGVYEYVEAARQVRARLPEARFLLAGAGDENPAAVSLSEIEAWKAEGVVEPLGHLADVRPALRACHVFVLPSYREGLPRTALEAMAIGRPIVTTDVPGCRETVEPGVNGYLAAARDADSLARAMLQAVADPARVRAMATRSRAMAQARFEARAVARRTLALILGDA